jgi:hypothetical protein
MISFILYSNILLLSISLNTTNLDQFQVGQKILATFYSIWTLDFFRFIIPPFCVSPNLKIIHILYLQTVSAVSLLYTDRNHLAVHQAAFTKLQDSNAAMATAQQSDLQAL